MRVLIISQFYHPEPVPKPNELAEALVSRGHTVTTITGFPNYPGGRLYPGWRIRPWTVDIVNGVRVVRVPIFPDHSHSALRRVINYGSFAATASVLGPLLSGPLDVVYAWHPPTTTGIPAWLLSRLRRVPLLYAVHDLWPENVIATDMMREGPATRLMEWLELFVYRRAKAVGVVSPGFVEHLKRKGVPASKIHVLTDWADEQVYRPLPADMALADELGMVGKFNVVYGGQIGYAQALHTVVEAADRLRQHPDLQFILAGDGLDKAPLEEEATRRGLANVRFLGWQAPERMARIYALADALLVTLKDQPVFRLGIPSKTYAYMACGKPLLMALSGVAAELVEEAGAGVACSPEDPDALAARCIELLRMPEEHRASMGRAARELYRKRFSKQVGVDAHERLLLELSGRGSWRG